MVVMGSHTAASVPAFAALQLLRTYNHLLCVPGGDPHPLPPLLEMTSSPGGALFSMTSSVATPAVTSNPGLLPPPALLGAFLPPPGLLPPPKSSVCTGAIPAPTSTSAPGRRPRSQKRPIPESSKDDKYYERRRRNNEAAKKSRDARRMREDQIALRAAMLEQENAVLRAQLMTVREEAESLRRMLGEGLPSL